jgi:hypothetical protein
VRNSVVNLMHRDGPRRRDVNSTHRACKTRLG